jgi:hypothetical protein
MDECTIMSFIVIADLTLDLCACSLL